MFLNPDQILLLSVSFWLTHAPLIFIITHSLYPQACTCVSMKVNDVSFWWLQPFSLCMFVSDLLCLFPLEWLDMVSGGELQHWSCSSVLGILVSKPFRRTLGWSWVWMYMKLAWISGIWPLWIVKLAAVKRDKKEIINKSFTIASSIANNYVHLQQIFYLLLLVFCQLRIVLGLPWL